MQPCPKRCDTSHPPSSQRASLCAIVSIAILRVVHREPRCAPAARANLETPDATNTKASAPNPQTPAPNPNPNQASYPTRIPYNAIFTKYRAAVPEEMRNLAPAEFTESLALSLGVEPAQYALGRSMIFFRLGAAAVSHTGLGP